MAALCLRGFSTRDALSSEPSRASEGPGVAVARFPTPLPFFAAFFDSEEASDGAAAGGAAGGMATFRAEATEGFAFAATGFSTGEGFSFAPSDPPEAVAGFAFAAPVLLGVEIGFASAVPAPAAAAGFAFAPPVSAPGREVTGPVEPVTFFAFLTDLRFVATRALKTLSSCRGAYSGAMTSTPPM